LKIKTRTDLQEDSQESYGRCKVLTTPLESYGSCKVLTTLLETTPKNQSSWTRPKCKQWSMRLSQQLLLKRSLQLSRLCLLLLLYQELSQGQPSSQSILLELAILHGTSRLARD
jgi:hypothetical protein